MNDQMSKIGLEIAVIGMAGRFPGASHLCEFWENLKNGVESIFFFSDQELEEDGVESSLADNPAYVKARGVLEGIEYFDATFFDYTPTEARLLDPQVRIFHECAWQALEDGGYNPDTYKGKIGVYAGASTSIYWQALSILSGALNVLDEFSAYQLIDKDFLAMRISFKFNLRGPSFAVQTACSTSLVAIHLACQGLLSGECGLALAGGVTATVPQEIGYIYQEGMVVSPDGHCRAFDAQARGFVPGSGAGVVVLKPLEDAITHGNHIYALIKGSAINNDGQQKAGFTAPSIQAQSNLVKDALSIAEVEPESISYIETHGTATPLGDSIEIESLTRAFNVKNKKFCHIGSVKTNIGHLDSAAGVAGFIKTVLALKHRQIPPSLHFNTPNPDIDFANTPFLVNTQLLDWKNGDYPLRAGVSSFGIGGTNAHVVLEEWPMSQGAERKAHSEGRTVPGAQSQGRGRVSSPVPSREYQLILLSARTTEALDKMTQNLAQYLKRNPGINLADAAYTLQLGRRALKSRRMLVCSHIHEAAAALADISNFPTYSISIPGDKNRVVFMFAGLGSQYVNMGWDLYQKETLFREEMDYCFQILKGLLKYDIKDILYPFSSSYKSDSAYSSAQPPADPGKINRFDIAQLVVFIFEYAVAKLLMKWGITPDAMIGYSFGEYTAACLSGVFSLEDVLKLIVIRGQLISRIPGGSLLSVPLPASQLDPLLPKEFSIAIDNGTSCIVSGPTASIEILEKQLKEKRHLCMKLPHSHAIHSKMMEPILNQFTEHMKGVRLNKPRIPYISNVTGEWITLQQATDAAYWSKHLRATVRFADGIEKLIKRPNSIFIEIGPGRDLTALLARHRENDSQQRALNLIRPAAKNVADDYYLLTKLGRLWIYGVTIDWKAFNAGEKRHRLSLPTYAFDRESYWIDGNPFKIAAQMSAQNPPLNKEKDIIYRPYIPSWQISALPFPIDGGEKKRHHSSWLFFIDNSDFGSQLAEQLKREGEEVACVKIGNIFKKENDFLYTIHPKKADDYDMLLSHLPGLKNTNTTVKIIHLWDLTGKVHGQLEFHTPEQARELGFYSLLYLAKAIGRKEGKESTGKREFQITVITNNMQKVPGDDIICPGKAAVLAPIKTIPLEYPYISCTGIDIRLPGPGSWQETRLKNHLLAELKQDGSDQITAYRGMDRLVPVYEPMPLPPIPQKAPPAAPLKKEGVYLVTGGLEGIGFEIAEYLARILQPKLVLIECAPLPDKNEPQQINEQFPAEELVTRELEEKIDFLTKTEETIEKKLDIKPIETFDRLEEKINEFCTSLILDYFKSNSINVDIGEIYAREDLKQELKILPKFNKFFDFFINVLVEDNMIEVQDSKIMFLKGVTQVNKPSLLLKEAEKEYPQFKGTIRLIDYCANNYRPALSGELEAISILFPDGNNVRLKGDYRDSVVSSRTRVYFLMLLEFILRILEESPANLKKPFKLLEVGGGNGFLTGVIAPGLINKNVEYHFTDIGNFFVINARKEASQRGLNFMQFGTLDIAKDPGEQGYENHSFDMILAYNVVHTTRNIEESIENLKQLLVPNGLMCLIESTNPKRWLNMIDGLAEGWWYFEDEDIRQNSPLLSLLEWENVLKRQGFYGITAFPKDQKSRAVTDCGLIVARKKKETTKNDWPIGIHENETNPIKHNIRNLIQLEKLGASVQVITVDIANPQQMKESIHQAEERFGQINGVIHCTDIKDHEKEIQISSLETIDEIFTAKVKETLVLEEIFNQSALDFFVLCSSLDPLYASPRILNTCAVNIFFNYFAQYKSFKGGGFIVSINWDPYMKTVSGEDNNEKVADIFGFVLNHGFGFSQVVVSNRDLTRSIQPGHDFNDHVIQESLERTTSLQPKYQRSRLSSKYAAPTDKTQQILVDIWQEFLGIEPIGIYDDFFELGADSLIFITIAARIHQALNVNIPLEVFFSRPTIEELAAYITGTQKDIFFSIEPIEKKEYFTLSSAQKRLYFIWRFEKQGIGYNIPYVWMLEGNLDKNRFEDIFRHLIKRHESFRTSFEIVKDEAVQRINKYAPFEIQYHDINGTEVEVEAEIEEIINRFIRPFDLSHAPLLRVGLININQPGRCASLPHQKENPGNRYILMVDMHHIISDGTSMGILIEDFMALYKGKELPQLKLQYKDFSKWQNQEGQNQTIKQQETFWLKQFEDEIPILNWSTDYIRPSIQDSQGRKIGFEMGKEETLALKRIAAAEGATLFMIILAICNVFLSGISGQEDIVIGIPTAGRQHTNLEKIIGMFINTLAIRNYPTGDKTFNQLLKEVKTRTLEVFENQDYQIEILVDKLAIERTPGRNPLFDVLFQLNNVVLAEVKLPGLTLKPHPYEKTGSKFDMTIVARESDEKLLFKIYYKPTLFKEETIQGFIRYFNEISAEVIKDPGMKLYKLGSIAVTEQTSEEISQFTDDLENE